MAKPRLSLPLGALLLFAMSLACGGGSEPKATPTPKPAPSPVAVAQQPAEGYRHGDPSFDALPGALSYFGPLGGADYRIEMPDEWNGRLVLVLHGSHNSEPQLFVETPSIRRYLIRNGFAWAASSYSSNGPTVAGLGVEESAALWDFFVGQFGRPRYTYVSGGSLGGIATILSAERYADRYDGALPLCGAIYSDSFVDLFVAGAYVAGVTQVEFESTTAGDLLDRRILPALARADTYEQFRNILIDLTGGARPLAQRGVDVDIAVFDMWTGSRLIVDSRLWGNQDVQYQLGPEAGVTSEAFNATAIRYRPGPLNTAIVRPFQATGALRIPTLTLNTTGETRVPLDAVRDLQRLADAAGAADLLVQRTVRDARHCGFTDVEWQQGLEDLVAWVEDGKRPEGEDVLNDEAADLGEQFTLAPRYGLPEADDVPGAGARLAVSGSATLDGLPAPIGSIRANVRGPDGLMSRSCTLEPATVLAEGRYSLVVAADEEMASCGRAGSSLLLIFTAKRASYTAQELAAWPAGATELAFHPAFSSRNPAGAGHTETIVVGAVLDADGNELPPGTLIEAFAGDTRCGITTVPAVVTLDGGPSAFLLAIVGPDMVPGCVTGSPVSLRVDSEPIEQTLAHDLALHEIDLIAPSAGDRSGS